jgi:DNA-binding NtrC family response regulator
MMQADDGIDLLGWIQEVHSLVSLILVSCYGHPDEVLERIRPAHDDYDQKPLAPRRMIELIDSIVRSTTISMRESFSDPASPSGIRKTVFSCFSGDFFRVSSIGVAFSRTR